jgi:hypothetical protein
VAASLQPNSDAGFSSLPQLLKAFTVVMDTYADLDKLIKTGTIVLQAISDRHSAPSCGEMHTI